MNKLPDKKLKEIQMVIESLTQYETLEIKRKGNSIQVVRKSTYMETFDLEDK